MIYWGASRIHHHGLTQTDPPGGSTRPGVETDIYDCIVCEGGAACTAIPVSVPTVAVVRRTHRRPAGLAGAIGEVHAAAAENAP